MTKSRRFESRQIITIEFDIVFIECKVMAVVVQGSCDTTSNFSICKGLGYASWFVSHDDIE